MKKSFIALTGASGIVYGFGIMKAIQQSGYEIHITATDEAILNAQAETGLEYTDTKDMLEKNKISDCIVYDINDSGAAVASGSFKVDNYIIAPASMGFIGRVANGVSSNLAERCADVAIKERRPLVILFREMPLSNIHLENLLKLNKSGVVTMPAAPGFYHKPENINDLINFVSGKVLDILNIENNCFKRWKS